MEKTNLTRKIISTFGARDRKVTSYTTVTFIFPNTFKKGKNAPKLFSVLLSEK